MNSQIRLQIAGTRERRTGFTPLLVVGPSFDPIVMERGVSMIAESPYYVIKHTADNVIYLLVDTQVCPNDVDISGVLCIALVWSADKKLADNKSPYSLLSAIYRTFQALYMHPSGGRYKFTDTAIDNEIFERIIESCHLESSSKNYVSMEGSLTGIVCVPADKLDDFFRDTQYSEFRKYKDIEIGTSCQKLATPELAGLEIPRPVSYEVWVNGKSVSFFLSKEKDGYTASAPATSTYEYESVSFTLGELLGAKNGQLQKGGGSVISLDAAHERIDCQLKKKEIKYLVRLGWVNLSETARTEILALLKEKKVGIKLSDMLLDWKDEVYVPASKVHDSVALTSSQWGVYNLSVFSSVDTSARVLMITIKGQSGIQRKQMSDNVLSAYVENEMRPSEVSSGSQQVNRVNRWRKQRRVLVVGILVGILLGVGGTFLWQNLSGKENVAGSEESASVEVAAETKEEPVENDSLSQKIDSEAAEKKAVEKEAARTEIQHLVVEGNLAACRAHPGWKKYLTLKERNTVEGLLDLRYKKGSIKKNLESLREKYLSTFTWEQVDYLNNEIVKIVNNYKYENSMI
ncbi:hypothetical protein [uncultured Bacteroides sp.]|uniref:hypothetical protein n=1 Tax=uncultured Bacteroides sp. TaxID=162156 RepID=UPI00280ABD52|nr:hypothetical protein [uncultured Bacteroides sp.]